MSNASAIKTRSRFQFTLKRMLLATFWMAVCFGGVIANRSIPPQWDFRGPRALWESLMIATFYIGLISPFIAIGTLFGRAKAGAIIGFIAASAFCVVVTSVALFIPGMNQSPAETTKRIMDCTTHFLLLVAGISSALIYRYRLTQFLTSK